MDRFGFWYQPLVLGYVWPKHLYPFPHWSYQLVVHRIHSPQKKKIVLTETIFSFFKNVPFPRGPIINLYYYVMVTPRPPTHTTINHLGGSGLSTPFQTCWDTLYVHILSGQKLIKNAKNGPFGATHVKNGIDGCDATEISLVPPIGVFRIRA